MIFFSTIEKNKSKSQKVHRSLFSFLFTPLSSLLLFPFTFFLWRAWSEGNLEGKEKESKGTERNGKTLLPRTTGGKSNSIFIYPLCLVARVGSTWNDENEFISLINRSIHSYIRTFVHSFIHSFINAILESDEIRIKTLSQYNTLLLHRDRVLIITNL